MARLKTPKKPSRDPLPFNETVSKAVLVRTYGGQFLDEICFELKRETGITPDDVYFWMATVPQFREDFHGAMEASKAAYFNHIWKIANDETKPLEERKFLTDRLAKIMHMLGIPQETVARRVREHKGAMKRQATSINVAFKEIEGTNLGSDHPLLQDSKENHDIPANQQG